MWSRIGFKRAFPTACFAILIAFSVSSQAEAGRLTGTVVDREGQAAAGAKVWAAKFGFMEPLDAHEALADASGVFSIEAGPGTWGVFAIRGMEGGRIGWESIPKIEDGKDQAPVMVRLRPPTILKGRLIDAETGDPIAKGSFALDDARRFEVDAEGRFEAPGLDMTNHEAYPLCPGYERKRILFDTTGRPDARLELKLPRAGKVVGRVVDVNGKPIPGASVGLRTSGSIFSGSALWEKCAEDGRFTYDGKPLGRTGRLSARAPGYSDEEREDVVALDATKPTEISFTLRPDPTKPSVTKIAAKVTNRRSVSGTVVGPEGKPVASAVVRWDLLVSSDSVPETTTAAQGAFRLEGVPDSSNVLSVMAKGLAPSFPMVDAGGDRQVKVEMKAGATIRGRVIDDAGKPIEGVWVVPQVPNPKPNWGGSVYLDQLQANTDRDGRFTLEGMPAGVKCDMVAEGWSAVRQRELWPSDESKNVVTLLGAGAIRGRVVDQTGSPVRNFRIQVGIPKDRKPGEPVGGYFAGYGGTGLAFTRDDGEFTISGLEAGHFHLLTVIAEGFGVGEADRVEAQSINRLKPAAVLTIKLGLPHSLRVLVFREGGKVVEGASVNVIQNQGSGGFQWGISDSSWDDSVSARAGANGWAEFPALAFGKGTIIVRAKGFSRRKLDWAKGEEEFAVDLEPESKLSGTVLDNEGKPVLGARIMLTWGAGEMVNVAIDEKDGRFLADGLGSGNYRLNVILGAGQAPLLELIELESGKTIVKDIRVQHPNPARRPGVR
jgi:protocatechuate 3,4-dioxygenase beta subunit